MSIHYWSIVLAYVLFSGAISLNAQEGSLLTQLNGNLQHCAWLDRVGERDRSLRLLEETLVKAEKLGNVQLEGETRLCLIRHFNRYQLRDSLTRQLDPLIAFSLKYKLDKIRVEALYFKSLHLLDTERYRESLQSCEAGNELARGLNDPHLTGLGLLCKGTVLRTSQNDTRPPLPYFYQALPILESTRDTGNLIRAALLITSGEQDNAKREAMMALAENLSKVYRSETTRMSVLNFKAAQLTPEAAIPLLREALEIGRRLRIPNMIQHLLLQLNSRYIALHRFDQALACLDSAKITFPGNIPYDWPLYYYAIYKEKGDYKKAVAYMEQFRQYEDERKQQDMKSFVAEWETRMNTREKEWAIEQQKSEIKAQKTRSLLLGFNLLLVLIAGAFVVYAYIKQSAGHKLLAEQNETIIKQSEALIEVESLKSRFFANVSHELRTPLTLMLGPVGNLLQRDYWTESDRFLLRVVQRNGQQLLRLVNEILDLSKLESGRMEVRESAVNCYSFFQPMVAQFGSYADSESVQLHFDYRASKDLNIYIDRGKFEKIVHNFLSNALKFSPKGGQVDLICTEEAEHLLVTVKDSGPGIHTDDLPYIFDRFYQSKRPDAPTQGGTGIGLSICREMAELLQGTVWVESDYGHGSAFYFRFPKSIAPAEAVAQPEIQATPGELAPGTGVSIARTTIPKYCVLVVEDNAELREYLRIVLSDYHVLIVENGKTAWDLLVSGENRPDLILSDLMMPVMDGFQLLEQVKGKDTLRHIPFIMLTARADVRVKLRALRIGVDDYLTKPFVAEELTARIENLLENYRERLELAAAWIDEPDLMPEGSRPVISQLDAAWLETVESLFKKNLGEPQFTMEWVAHELNISSRQFTRRLKQITGLTPNHYLREMRLCVARELLYARKFSTVKETGYAVGFLDAKYFSGLFQKRFGLAPSEYLAQ